MLIRVAEDDEGLDDVHFDIAFDGVDVAVIVSILKSARERHETMPWEAHAIDSFLDELEK